MPPIFPSYQQPLPQNVRRLSIVQPTKPLLKLPLNLNPRQDHLNLPRQLTQLSITRKEQEMHQMHQRLQTLDVE